MFGKSNSGFDRLADKATSQLLLEPDWDVILQICDWIRQSDVQPKYAVGLIKKKIANENPHVSVYGLQVLESIVKNCGPPVHKEVATREFMEFLKDQVKSRPEPVKNRVLELVQVWSHAFRDQPQYKIVSDTYNLMKMEGHTFPALREADAMFNSETAPEWKEGDCCNRCRVQFTTLTRRHHCRNCGQIFCHKCSSKNSIIPKYGIEREVRVCDSCFDSLNKPAAPGAAGKDDVLPQEYLNSPLSKQPQGPPQRSEADMQEEEELQLALAISQSEAEAEEKKKRAPVSRAPDTRPQPVQVTGPVDTSDMDPELARYLNRNYWEQRSETGAAAPAGEAQVSVTEPSAPAVQAGEPQAAPQRREEAMQNGEDDADREQFLKALTGSIDILVNRMKSNSQRGRSIANDSSVQTLFQTLTAMQPQLMGYLKQQEDNRAYYESLQDKLAQLRDAREALDALRDEHRERRRREQEELDRQRKIQMMQKLEIMRQKKQEYLEYQRQLQLQRMQEYEREMQARLEQQKQMQAMRAMGYTLPQTYMSGPEGYPPPQPGQPGPEGSPQHQVYGAPAGALPPGAMLPPGAQPPAAGMPPPGAPVTGVQQMQGYQPGVYGQAPGAVPVGQAPGAVPVGQAPGAVPVSASLGYMGAGQTAPSGGDTQYQTVTSGDYAPYNMTGLATSLPTNTAVMGAGVPVSVGQAMPPGAPGQQAMMPAGCPPGQLPPGQQLAPGQIPPGQLPPGQLPPGQLPPGQLPPGQLPPGQLPPGQLPPGQLPPGQQVPSAQQFPAGQQYQSGHQFAAGQPQIAQGQYPDPHQPVQPPPAQEQPSLIVFD